MGKKQWVRESSASSWVVILGLVVAAGCSGGGEGAGSGGSSGGDASSGGGGGGGGGVGTPACVGACQPSQFCNDAGVCTFSECSSDQDCPSTVHNYLINGAHCVAVCGSIHLCRDLCTTDSECGTDTQKNPLHCSAVADDGTHYCESVELGAYKACTPGSCGANLTCSASFRPAS